MCIRDSEMDKTRMTTIAHVSMVPMENDMHHITDAVSYTHLGALQDAAWQSLLCLVLRPV